MVGKEKREGGWREEGRGEVRVKEMWLGASSEADGGVRVQSLGVKETTETRPQGTGSPKRVREPTPTLNCVVNCGTRVASRPVAW